MVQLPVEALVVPNHITAQVAQQATTTIPIVMAGAGAIAHTVPSLAQPVGTSRGVRAGAGALVVCADGGVLLHHRAHLPEQALIHRLPSIFGDRAVVEAGGLMRDGASPALRGQRLAAYVDKPLNGTKPADLPVEQSTTFELVINLKTAQALRLTIPPTLLFQADEVIR
jgi:ABC-type uncharacterized transport system substrate-binding protein